MKHLANLAILFILISVQGAFGITISEKCTDALTSSNNFDRTKRQFINQNQTILDNQSRKDLFEIIQYFASINKNQTRPIHKLPQVTPNLSEFVSHKQGIYYIWFGHSTFLLNFNGKIILFDPVFSTYASPVKFVAKRFQAPVVNLQDLPEIDYVVISHDHYDHLDRSTVRHFINTDTQFIVPLGVSFRLVLWDIAVENIRELDWWGGSSFGDLEFIATPAQHFSGRSLHELNKTLWVSWVIRDKTNNIYFSGDSGYSDHFSLIGERYGPFDITFIENGQYNLRQSMFHLYPEQTVLAFRDLKGKKLMSIHWGMFDLSDHNWFDPIEISNWFSSVTDVDHFTPIIGEIVDVLSSNKTTRWWKPFMANNY